MASFEELFSGNEAEWIDALPVYQRDIIKALLAQGRSYDEIAIAWLSAGGPTNTFPFGAQGGSQIFYEKFLEEIEKFLCREDCYSEDRKKLMTDAEATKTLAISLISEAIAPVLHASTPYLAPVVTLALITATKLGRNAWCAMRQEQRNNLHKDPIEHTNG